MYFRQLNEIKFNLTNWIREKQADDKLFNSKDHSENGKWPYSIEDLPWFDQPGAKDFIDSLKLAPADKSILKNWLTNGYIIADVLDPDICDLMITEIKNALWGLKKKFPNIEINNVQSPEESNSHAIIQPLLCKYNADEREWMYQNNRWRIHGLMHYSYIFHTASKSRELRRISSLIFNEPARAGFSLNFANGSEQKLHQDIAQFHIYPRNFLIGVWIALEDIHPDSGPVEFYPGTHKLGLWNKHAANYPQTNLRTLGSKNRDEYFDWLIQESKKISAKKTLIIKKGQALFWHACLAHGGSLQKDHSRTRHSYVLH
ncbi:MAG: hypothetical protein HKN08_02540, partial [Gammaproteobacteria bacterium]|nr:hypothetical protein [Gammaproteobacteria bacterium]